jgi:cytochrome c-type biogenesis protein CcmF
VAAIGSAALVVALITALYAVGASLIGARTGRRQLVVSGRRAIYCLAGLLSLCMVLVWIAFLRDDFSFTIVFERSSTDTPTFYKFTGMWSTQEGSLLLWAFLLSVYSSLALYATRRKHREVVPYATAVLGAIGAFFISLMVIWGETPFGTVTPVPTQGQGLTPLLRHPAMMIHPPMLYSGYVGFSIPFAFAVGALITRQTNADWIRTTRRFTLLAWAFLGCGILLGALWSYSELGWGGYWAWDPVENASLMPWLTGTAFLHSVMIQEKRGMLKIWNVSLVIGTFVLALLGTFLVRSGVLDSIHAFGASTLGRPFLFFIAVVLVSSVVLVLSRLDDLKSQAKLDSLMSRESVFLLNNLVLVGLCFVIFWGTFFPLISEAVKGQKASLGPPWFDKYTVPLAIVLVLLSGIGPVIAWRRVTVANLRHAFVWPAAIVATTLVVLLAFTNASDSIPSLIMFALVAFVLSVVGQEFARGASARRVMTREPWPIAVRSLIGRNRRRYGGYTVHAGIAILFLGVAASSAFLTQRDARLMPGQSAQVGDYKITYVKPTSRFLDRDQSGTGAPLTLGAVIRVHKGSKTWDMHPGRNYYQARDGSEGAFSSLFDGESTSEVDLKWGATKDFWLAVQPDLRNINAAVAEADRKFAKATLNEQGLIMAAIVARYQNHPVALPIRAIVSPLVGWIWVGGVIALLGAVLALWPSPAARRREVASAYKARLGTELSRA